VQVFILGDADRVREKVERALLDGNLGEVTYFSRNLTSAVEALVRDVEQAFEAITVMMCASGPLDIVIVAGPFSKWRRSLRQPPRVPSRSASARRYNVPTLI